MPRTSIAASMPASANSVARIGENDAGTARAVSTSSSKRYTDGSLGCRYRA